MPTMTMTARIQDHMEVVGSEGVPIGLVDDVQGEYIKLTKEGSTDGEHHFIDMELVERVDDKVHLAEPADEVMKDWGYEF